MPRRIRSAEYNGNVYFTSSTGILKSEAPTALYGPAGMPRGLDVQLALTASVTGIMVLDDNYAYRVLWGIRDLNNNVVIGAPSNRVNIRDTVILGNQNVNVTFLVPAFITTSHFFQIYRTKKLNGATADPGDIMFLVYEANPTAAEIAAGTITVTDIRPDDIVGEELYTNATQQGIAQANYQPPLARDIAVFRDFMFLSNTTQKQNVTIALIGMNGFVAGTSTVTIGGVVYNCASYGGAYSTAPAGENTATGTFVFYTAGTTAERIRGTAESLCRVINRYSVNIQYYAYYSSEITDTPGIIYLEERRVGGASFAVIAHSSINNNFEPKLPTSGTLVSSTADTRKNWLFYSKEQQPEAFPLVNYLPVGAQNEAIQRILALKDVLIILKENSAWILTGSGPANFTVSPLDANVSIGDRYDSAAVVNNQVFCLTEQGITVVGPSGAQVISQDEEFNLRFPTADGDGFSVGIGHENLRGYLLSTFDAEFKQEGYTYPYSTYAYNYGNDEPTITRWLLNASCFTVFKNRLYYGLNNIKGHVLKQRQYAYEFFDETATAAVSAIVVADKTAQIAFTASVDYDTYPSQFGYPNGFGQGWVIVDGGNRYLVTDFNPMTTVATFQTVSGLTNGSKSTYRPIPIAIEWMPITLGRPDTEKEFTEVKIIGCIDDSYQIDFSFANEDDLKKYFFYYKYSAALATSPVLVNDLQTPWVFTRATRYRHIRTNVPNLKKGGAQLSVRIVNNVAGARIAIKALSVTVRPTDSDRTTQ